MIYRIGSHLTTLKLFIKIFQAPVMLSHTIPTTLTIIVRMVILRHLSDWHLNFNLQEEINFIDSQMVKWLTIDWDFSLMNLITLLQEHQYFSIQKVWYLNATVTIISTFSMHLIVIIRNFEKKHFVMSSILLLQKFILEFEKGYGRELFA